MSVRTLAMVVSGGLFLFGISVPRAWSDQAEALFKSKCLLCHSQKEAQTLPGGQTWTEFLRRHRTTAPWLISGGETQAIGEYLTGLDRRRSAGGGQRIDFSSASSGTTYQLVMSPAGKLHASVVNPRFNVSDAAYATAELMLAGVPFFEQLAQRGLPLDAELASITSEDAFWYSRYNMETMAVQSGIGLHLVHARNLVLQAQEDNVSPREYLDGLLTTYRERTGLETAPRGLMPIYAPFTSGMPFLLEVPDFKDAETLRWDHTKFDKTLSTSALGYSMVAETLWAGYFLGATHDDDRFGNDASEGYLGALLLTQVINNLYLLKDELAFDGDALGEVQPFSYEATLKYFPHRYSVEIAYDDLSAPPKPARFMVADTSSQLADQCAVLWGVSEFYHVSDPKIEDAWDGLFGSPADGALFPPETHDVARGLAQVVIKNLVAMHFDTTKKTFVSTWDGGDRGQTLTAADAGLLLMALERVHTSLHDAEALRADVEKLVEWQAVYLSENLQQRDGGFIEEINTTTAAQSAVPRTLLGQSLAIRGLLAAHKVTGDDTYRNGALTAFQFMEDHLWSASANCYRTAEGSDLSLHTPRTVAATLGALRELVLATGNEQALARFKTFFTQAVKRHGLQLAEREHVGETAGSVKEALMPDADGDGVRKPAFAGGSFGAAPVFVSQVQIPTP